MDKVSKIALIVAGILLTGFLLYSSLRSTKEVVDEPSVLTSQEEASLVYPRPYCALIFDDLGTSIKEIKDLYELNIPLTISVFPEEKFSKNVAYIGHRCGFSVLIHLPLEPKRPIDSFTNVKETFIGRHHSRRQNQYLLRKYLNSLRIAIGVNNHMGSKATEDRKIMSLVLNYLKRDNLVFIDSRTSLDSIACEVAARIGVRCKTSDGFVDSAGEAAAIREKIQVLIERGRQKGKMIIIAHPHQTTLNVLREVMPDLKKQVQFVTLKDYLEL